MSNQKLTQLNELSSIDYEDILYVVDDPGGSPISKKISMKNLQANNINFAKGQIISGIYNICSDPANIIGLWVFDQDGESTTVTDRGTKSHNLTLSANGSTLNPSYTGLCPNLNLTSNAYFEVSDHNDFSFGDGSTDNAFSIVALLNFNDATSSTILAKDDKTTASTNREWAFYTDNNDKLFFDLHDDDAGAYIGRSYNTAITSDEGLYNTYIATYSGGGVSTNVNIYKNGTVVDDTDHNNSTYTAMENKTGKIGNYNLDSAGARENAGDYKAGIIALIKEELAEKTVKQLDQLLRAYAGNNL